MSGKIGVSDRCPSQNNNNLTTYGQKYLYENFRIKLRSCSNPEKHGTKNYCIEISKFTFPCVFLFSQMTELNIKRDANNFSCRDYIPSFWNAA